MLVYQRVIPMFFPCNSHISSLPQRSTPRQNYPSETAKNAPPTPGSRPPNACPGSPVFLRFFWAIKTHKIWRVEVGRCGEMIDKIQWDIFYGFLWYTVGESI